MDRSSAEGALVEAHKAPTGSEGAPPRRWRGLGGARPLPRKLFDLKIEHFI